jgi:tetrahydromethanopterin S-methyltransferase subunit F
MDKVENLPPSPLTLKLHDPILRDANLTTIKTSVANVRYATKPSDSLSLYISRDAKLSAIKTSVADVRYATRLLAPPISPPPV